MSGAHRYWRLVNLSTAYFTIGEIVLRDVPGGPQIAVGGVAFASAPDPWANSAPSLALDGNTTTHYHSPMNGAGNNWWAYDFGAGNAKDVVEMVFTQRTENADWSPSSWRADYSDDGSTWKVIAAGTGNYPAGVPVTTLVRPLRPDERTMRVFEPGAIRMRGRQLAQGRPDQPVFDPARERWLPRPQLWHSANMEHGGLFKLDGTTTSLGIPAPRRVRLYHQFNGQLMGEQLTDADGAFSFTHIEEGPWMVVGLDDTGAQNGVIFSHVKAVPMVL